MHWSRAIGGEGPYPEAEIGILFLLHLSLAQAKGKHIGLQMDCVPFLAAA
jgi:hypothetical protein